MNLIFVTSTLTSGGAERVISLLANEFANQGHEVELICLTNLKADYYKVDDKVKLTHAEDIAGHSLLKRLLWLRQHIKESNCDCVVAFMEAVYEFVLMALLGTGIPVISSERKDPSTLSITRKILRWFLLPTASAHVVQTKKIKEYYNRCIQKKTHIIYNPVNSKVFDIATSQRKKRIISVGRLFDQKNHKMMIDAFMLIAYNYPEWQLVIYGEGPLRETLEKRIEAFGLQERVLLLGRSENVINEVAQSEIFCLSSDYEGMSNAMIEAMCLGVPVISTKVSGTDELLHDKEDSLLIDIGDTYSLSRAFASLISNEVFRKQYGERCKKKSEMFKLKKITSEWEQLIIKVSRHSGSSKEKVREHEQL